MKLQLFPEQFLQRDACFGLFELGANGELDLPITIETEVGIPLHIVHSDPDHLAFLVGLIVLQAWTSGIDDLGVPSSERRPLLVVTDRPGRFGEAYLRLHLPLEKIKALSVRRRVTLFEKTGRAPDASSDKAGYWESYLEPGDDRTALHNFFPACQVLGTTGNPRVLASRQHLGRSDQGLPAVLITRRSDRESLRSFQDRYHPFLALFDTHATAAQGPISGVPAIFYHESIFAPELTRQDEGKVVLSSLPDARFERFCAQAGVRVVEPKESEQLVRSWQDVDSALQALIERVDERRDPVVVAVQRSALRLRNLLLSLPVGITSYEQALVASGQPESLWYDWSITQPLQALESRLPEMAALGEWEELILQELVDGFGRLTELLGQHSPKGEPLAGVANEIVKRGRRVAVVASSRSVASGLEWAVRFPNPLGLGLPPEKVAVITAEEIRRLDQDQDCIIHQVFEPHVVLSALARAGPRQVCFILLRNELRFVGEQFLHSRKLFPDHLANRILLRPVYQQIGNLEPTPSMNRREHSTILFSDSDFEMTMRMFDRGRGAEYGAVLFDAPDGGKIEGTDYEIEAYLFRLEGSVVFLDASGRLPYVRPDDVIISGKVATLEHGDRLIIVNPVARETIAHRILSARQEEETDKLSGLVIERWRLELAHGLQNHDLTYQEALDRMRELGSQRSDPTIIGQWKRGYVLGPLDVMDIRRIGEAIGSDWLLQNWQRVGTALFMIRSGHRLLGRKVTQLIQKASVGDFELARKDEEFLQQVGITMGELQDAVTLFTVEDVSEEARTVPIEQIGKVVPL